MLLEEIASIFATSKLRNHWQRVAHTTRGTTSETRPALSHHLSGSVGPGGTPTSLDLFTFRFAPGRSFSNAGDAKISRPLWTPPSYIRSPQISHVPRGLTWTSVCVVVVDASAVAPARGWMRKRWELLSEEGPSKRDSLLLAPAGDSRVCRRSEHRYSTEHAVQMRLMSELSIHHEPLLRFRVALLWALHSGESCLPRSVAALTHSKTERDALGLVHAGR